MPTAAPRLIFYDTETTGLNHEQDRIIEIAAYDPESDSSFVQLINPGQPIPAAAAAVHHITDEMVANSPPFAEVIEAFSEFCSPKATLIAHNNDAFDIHFLRAEFGRNSRSIPESWRFIDSLKWARRYRRDLPRHSLQFLREVFGIAANQAHRALDDVIVLHRVFGCLTDDLHIDQVYELMHKGPAGSASSGQPLTHMPFGKHQGEPLSKLPSSYIAWLKKSGAFDKAENQSLFSELKKLGKV